MISQHNDYTKEEVEKIYSAVEEALEKDDPLLDIDAIAPIIHDGDFFMHSRGVLPLFCFNGLRWIKDGQVSTVLIQIQERPYASDGLGWVVADVVDDRNLISLGDRSSIRKEYRYTKVYTPLQL